MDLFVVTLAGILAGYSGMFGLFTARRWGLVGLAEAVVGPLFMLPFALVISYVSDEGHWAPVIGLLVSCAVTWFILVKSEYQWAGQKGEWLGFRVLAGGTLALIISLAIAGHWVILVSSVATWLLLTVLVRVLTIDAGRGWRKR